MAMVSWKDLFSKNLFRSTGTSLSPSRNVFRTFTPAAPENHDTPARSLPSRSTSFVSSYHSLYDKSLSLLAIALFRRTYLPTSSY
eukprot:1515970-Rhodomonas_salina.2